MKGIRIRPVRHLAAVVSRDGGFPVEWESTGVDPGFLIALPFVRKRFLLIELEGREGMLDPQLYVNYGFGFRERGAFSPEPSAAFLFVVDIGAMGMVRALRLDPATFRTRFAWRMQEAGDRQEVERIIEERNRDRFALAVHRIGDLNSLARAMRHLLPELWAPRVADHARSLYALAGRETAGVRASEADPWLSIVVPVYDAPRRYLNDLLRSFRAQAIAGVELILSDDASPDPQTRKWLETHSTALDMAVVFNERNGGIAAALNAGLSRARGEWVTFLDHDDLLAPHALKLIYATLRRRPETEFLYTDELVVDDRLKPKGYMLKPAYDPILLTGVNYINHLSVFRRRRLKEIGFLRAGFDGSQDYDLLLRYLDGVGDEKVLHLPYPAYWWRRNGHTYSRRFLERATANARRAIADHLGRRGIQGEVAPALTETLHRVAFARGPVPPKVSIIIPNRNAFPLIDRILKDLFERTDYPEFDVHVIDNGSDDRAVLDLYERHRRDHPNFSADIREEPFNFSRAVNRGMAQAAGEHFLLLNNDIEVVHSDWLQEMVSCLGYDGAGIVGAKLLYPNGTLQHAGVIAGFGGLAGHWYLGKPGDYGGPMNRLHVRASMSCVTGAVMLISGACRQAVGDFDEENFAVAYNDVDYCLRAHGKGFRIVWTPFAQFYHHESASRGSENNIGNRLRFETEKANLRRLHGTVDFLDPAASPLHGRNHSTPQLKRVRSLPAARRWW